MNNLRSIVQSRPWTMKAKVAQRSYTIVLHAFRLNGFSHTNNVRWAGMFSSSCFALTKRAAAYFDPMTPLQHRVPAQLDLAVRDGLTVGAVMMAVQREKVLALEAAGYSDLAAKKPMRTDAIFDIRSISKPITVLGALLLVDDGKLTLGDPLAKFLLEISHLTVKGQAQPTNVPITLRQLMMHTSGVADERPPSLENITRTFDLTLTEDAALVAQQALDFTPGSRWAYSSSRIAVLGRVIEVASRQSFETFIQQRLLEPLEMQDSSFFTNRARVAGIPMYKLENSHLVKDAMDVTRPGQKYSALEFGPFSTAEDLRHLGQMMLNRGSWKGQKLLSSSLVEEMTRPCVADVRPQISCRSRMGYSYGKRAGDELRRHRRKLWSKRAQRLHLLDRSEHTTHSYLPDALLLGRF
jgi:CubicO group peptidase (beta-lactamase class C family)